MSNLGKKRLFQMQIVSNPIKRGRTQDAGKSRLCSLQRARHIFQSSRLEIARVQSNLNESR